MPKKSIFAQKYWLQQTLIILLVIVMIMLSAFMVVGKVFEYRHDYRTFTQLAKERDDLNAEWGRLLIEQQTFGATAQIGTRAVTQLRMYSPPAQQTVVASIK